MAFANIRGNLCLHEVRAELDFAEKFRIKNIWKLILARENN